MTNKQKKFTRQYAFIFVAALIGNWTIMTPWHEVGHMLGAWFTGHPAMIGGWNYTLVKNPTVFIYLAGPLWEICTYGALMLWMSEHKPFEWKWDAWFMGNIFSTYLITPFSDDIAEIANMSGYSWSVVGTSWLFGVGIYMVVFSIIKFKIWLKRIKIGNTIFSFS